MEVRYYLNEKNIKADFGIYVSASSGVLDMPKLKETNSQNWREYHGTVVDLDAPRMEDREIILDCFVNAESQLSFIQKINAFYSEFLKSGFKRLRVEIDAMQKPLIFDVYLKDGIKVTKQWTEGQQVGKFQIKLIEPNPQKKVLRFTATESNKLCMFDIQTPMAVCITYGDNSRADEVVSENGFKVRHEYAEPGEYYISISGVIPEIKRLIIDVNNTEEIWVTL